MKIGIVGITGRVGHLLVKAVEESGNQVSGGLSRNPQKAKGDASLKAFPIYSSVEQLAKESSVIIDFTNADYIASLADEMSKTGTPWVIGTTGLSHGQEEKIKKAAEKIAIVKAANFSPGIVLMNRLVEMMGKALPAPTYDAEIVEMHHRQKVDAPSGTALKLGGAVAKGRGVNLDDVAERGRDGHTGPRGKDAIGFAALRGGQIVGEHSVLFTSADEQLAITHRAFDRQIFANGAVQAAQWIAKKGPGLYDMENVLGIS